MPAVESLLLDRVEPIALSIDVVDDVNGFGELGRDWSDLLTNSRMNNPFLTWEWMYSWWRHLGESRTLQIITVRDHRNRLLALAPLLAVRGHLPWLTQVEFLGVGWAGSDYLDVIVRCGYESDCAEALAAWLNARARTIKFDHLRPDSVAAVLSERLRRAEWDVTPTQSGLCPYATLDGHSWESYAATLRPSQRTRCRRYLNSLKKKFELRFEPVETEAQREEILSALMNFHDQRWTPRGGSTAFHTPALRAFHHEVTTRTLNAGWLRMYALRLNDDIAAVTYCFKVDRRFYLYQHGFNPGFWQYSVGVVVLALTIEAGIKERATEFDMLYGDEPYKALWASEVRHLERLELFPPHLSGRWHRRTVNAERQMRKLARRIFPRTPCDSNVHPAGDAS